MIVVEAKCFWFTTARLAGFAGGIFGTSLGEGNAQLAYSARKQSSMQGVEWR